MSTFFENTTNYVAINYTVKGLIFRMARKASAASGAAVQKRVLNSPAERSEQRAFGASAATHSKQFIRMFSVGIQ